MNVAEVYTKYNTQLIIIISGLSGSGKTELSTNISKLFNAKLINLEHFTLKDYVNRVRLNNGVSVIDWDNVGAYDWTKLNDTVNENKAKGIVLCGAYFPTEKLKFTPDFHLHVKISKQKLIEFRHKYMLEHPTDENKLVIDTPTETLLINQITFPYYSKYIEQSKIDKWLNANELSADVIYDNAFSYIISRIMGFIKENKVEIDKFLHGVHSEKNDNDNSVNTKMDIKVDTKPTNKPDEDDDDISMSDSDDIKIDTESDGIYLGTTSMVA
jgi:tRNA A37 threonylcarbamoyladenosine biosynthesis protein TsaE